MTRIRAFLRSVSWPVALHTLNVLMVCIGAIALIAFIGTAHWMLACAAIPAFFFAWWILYTFEFAWRTRRTFGRGL